jgi:hypothetical protein
MAGLSGCVHHSLPSEPKAMLSVSRSIRTKVTFPFLATCHSRSRPASDNHKVPSLSCAVRPGFEPLMSSARWMVPTVVMRPRYGSIFGQLCHETNQRAPACAVISVGIWLFGTAMVRTTGGTGTVTVAASRRMAAITLTPF